MMSSILNNVELLHDSDTILILSDSVLWSVAILHVAFDV